MTRARAGVPVVALGLALLPACAVGAGGSLAGTWRAKRVVDSTACIETAPNVCGRVIEIGSEQPARSFGGGVFTFTEPGYARAQSGSGGEDAFELGASYEYMRGRGPYALAARVGFQLVNGTAHTWYVLPVTALAHYGGAWGSVFGGVGYAPFIEREQTGAPTAYLHDGVEGLVGTRIILRESFGHFITVGPELRYQRAGDANLFSATGNLGLHF